MHPSQLDLSELPRLMGKCVLRDQIVEVPSELRRLVVDAIAAKFPFDTVEDIPPIAGRLKVSGFSTVRLRRHLTRIEGDAVVMVGTLTISFGNATTESDAFDEMYEFVADVSADDICIIISHPSSH
jgi:hypothetical protein